MSSFKNREIREIAQFNPVEKMAINTIAKKIPMGNIREYQRKITGYEISEYKSGPKFRNGDVLLAKITPCLENGKTALVDILDSDEVAFGSTEFIVLRAKDNSDKEYLYYLARSPAFRKKAISCMEGTSGRKRVNEGALKLQELPIPDKHLQQKIAAALSTLDAKIDCNNRINAELEAMAKTLYDYWFVQFDFPDANGKPYKSSGGKMAYNATLKREIPEGWKHSTIGETFKTHLGGTPSRDIDEYWEPGEVSWLSSGENPSTYVVAPDEKISMLGLRNSPAKLLPEGTVILSIVRHLRASILGIEAATNQSVVGIVETEQFKHCFIYPYLVREIPRLMALRTGAQQPHINKGVLDESLLVIPDDATLNIYSSKASSLFLQIQNNLRQNMELAQLRDWLLPLLMNGQVTVA